MTTEERAGGFSTVSYEPSEKVQPKVESKEVEKEDSQETPKKKEKK